jgi:hypothetical protein
MWSIVRDPHDSKETITCAFRSVALFTGLGLNCLSGFWQADPLAGLVIVLFLFHEGYEGWTEAVDGGGVNRQAEILNHTWNTLPDSRHNPAAGWPAVNPGPVGQPWIEPCGSTNIISSSPMIKTGIV